MAPGRARIGPARPRGGGGFLGRALGGPGSSLTPGWGWILRNLLQNPQVLSLRPESLQPHSPLITADGRGLQGGRPALLTAQVHMLFRVYLPCV